LAPTRGRWQGWRRLDAVHHTFQPLWVWAIHGCEPKDTLRNDFTLDLGVPPPWTILALGLLITAVAFARRAIRPALMRPPRESI
jgi:hypothetical protein